MSRCGDCKFWGLPDEAKAKWRSCTAVVHDYSNYTNPCREETGNKWDDTLEERYEHSPASLQEALKLRETHTAVAVDGSGYYAALKTRDCFGCVLYQPRG